MCVSRWEGVSIQIPEQRKKREIIDKNSGTTVSQPRKSRSRLVTNSSVGTVLSFWSQEGAHTTRKQPWVDWNEEIIKAMVEVIEPSEILFRSDSKQVFQILSDSTDQGLSVLPRVLHGKSLR